MENTTDIMSAKYNSKRQQGGQVIFEGGSCPPWPLLGSATDLDLGGVTFCTIDHTLLTQLGYFDCPIVLTMSTQGGNFLPQVGQYSAPLSLLC